MEAFRLVAVRAGAEGRARHLDAPMVGRDRELATLTDAWRRAVDERTPHLVTLVAPAGVGKSRLVREFIERVRADGGRALVGRCLSYGEGITYWPVRELVHQAAGITEADDQAEARAKVAALVGADAGRRRVASRVAVGRRPVVRRRRPGGAVLGRPPAPRAPRRRAAHARRPRGPPLGRGHPARPRRLRRRPRRRRPAPAPRHGPPGAHGAPAGVRRLRARPRPCSASSRSAPTPRARCSTPSRAARPIPRPLRARILDAAEGNAAVRRGVPRPAPRRRAPAASETGRWTRAPGIDAVAVPPTRPGAARRPARGAAGGRAQRRPAGLGDRPQLRGRGARGRSTPTRSPDLDAQPPRPRAQGAPAARPRRADRRRRLPLPPRPDPRRRVRGAAQGRTRGAPRAVRRTGSSRRRATA